MKKVIITTVLDPDVKTKLISHSRKTYIPYSKLIEYSITEFNKKTKRVKEYPLKHTDFDRIKTKSFTCSVSEDINNSLLTLANKYKGSKRLLLREVITEFVKNNC